MSNNKAATQQESSPATAAAGNQPVHRIRISRIQASIWQNTGDNGPWYNVTLSRSYKDANDDWKSADSFSVDDLLVVAKIANEAHTWIIQKQHERT
jgi:hypothetical protein